MSKAINEQSRMHGKELSEAVRAEHKEVHAEAAEAVPGSEKTHGHSYAAHLQTEGDAHTLPFGKEKQGREPGTVNQPPQDPKRSGKAHHNQ